MICNFLHFTHFFNLENGSPYLRNMAEMEEWEAMMELPLVWQPVVYYRRADHSISLSDAEFKRTFRFSKTGDCALVEMLHDQLHFPTERGHPLTVLQQVLVALNHYAGSQYQRTTALCGGLSQSTEFCS
jgi:hypothetical protein